MITQTINLAVNLLITECKCKEFSFTKFAQENKIDIPFDKYQFDLSISLNIKPDEKTVLIEVKSSLFSISEARDKIADLDSNHKFFIQNFEQVAAKTPQGLGIPDQLVIQFITISVSNLRGLYSAKLEGSIYHNAVLPLVDATQLIPKRTHQVG